MDEIHPIDEAAKLADGLTGLARQLGVTKAAVWQWKQPGRLVPMKHCARIEALSGGRVTRQRLRPDDWRNLWPELESQEARQ